MTRNTISSGSPLESKIGFSRAKRVGNHIHVAGTAPIGADGETVGVGDVRAQTAQCLTIIAAALEEAGGALSDVTRTRVMLRHIDTWEEAAEAHGAVFADILPACTFVEVSRFIDPDWLVEIEADAILTEVPS